MTNLSIRSYNDLLQEEARLRNELNVRQEAVQAHIQELKQKIAPAASFLSAVGNITKPGKSSLISAGLGIAADLLLRKSLLRKAGWLTKLAGSFLVRKVVVNKLSPLVSNLLGQLANKKRAKQG